MRIPNMIKFGGKAAVESVGRAPSASRRNARSFAKSQPWLFLHVLKFLKGSHSLVKVSWIADPKKPQKHQRICRLFRTPGEAQTQSRGWFALASSPRYGVEDIETQVEVGRLTR
jgi:hypothetical protein